MMKQSVYSSYSSSPSSSPYQYHYHCCCGGCFDLFNIYSTWKLFFILVLLFLSTTSTAIKSDQLTNAARPITNVDDLIRLKKGASMFIHSSLSNYSMLLELPSMNLIYAVAADSSLVVIQQKTMEQMGEVYTLPSTLNYYPQLCGGGSRNQCQEKNLINLLESTKQEKFVWFCYLNEIFRLNTLSHFNTSCVVFSPKHSKAATGDLLRGSTTHQIVLTSTNRNMKPIIVHSNSEDFLYLATLTKDGPHLFRIPPPTTIKYTIAQTKSILMAKLSTNAEIVHGFEEEDEIFFALHELSYESEILCNLKHRVTRLAKLCKRDTGPIPDYMTNFQFSSLRWADLHCLGVATTPSNNGNNNGGGGGSGGGDNNNNNYNNKDDDVPFIYRIIKSASWDSVAKVYIALFQSDRNGPQGTAICVYTMESIKAVFNGQVRAAVVQSTTSWPPGQNTAYPNMCSKTTNLTPDEERNRKFDVFRSPYAVKPIRPITNSALLINHVLSGNPDDSALWKHVVVHSFSVNITMIFMATDYHLYRYALYQRPWKLCLIETLTVISSPSPTRRITFLKLSKGTDSMITSMYIGTDDRIIRLSLHRCDALGNKDACLGAKDPYCWWSVSNNRCQSRTIDPSNDQQDSSTNDIWQQDLTTCPQFPTERKSTKNNLLNQDLWSEWQSCPYRNSSVMGPCYCRLCIADDKSLCPNKIEIINCTVHGQWSSWSQWTPCNDLCGLQQQTRQRLCNSPAPQFGGNLCLSSSAGQENGQGSSVAGSSAAAAAVQYDMTATESRVCDLKPNCGDKKAVIDSNGPVNGIWSNWGSWGSCLTNCGSGYQQRKRECKPTNGHCTGNYAEWRSCIGRDCRVTQTSTGWTPWLLKVNTSTGIAATLDSTTTTTTTGQQQRFRFHCFVFENVNQNNPLLIQPQQQQQPTKAIIQSVNQEVRECNAQNVCTEPREENNVGFWSEWASWSACSVSCGGGHQDRQRSCSHILATDISDNAQACPGHSRERQNCNVNLCPPYTTQWSCWSEWSSCSVTCGSGQMTRTRVCSTNGICGPSPDTVQNKVCHVQINCADNSNSFWSAWNNWSECKKNEIVRKRTRQCSTTDNQEELCKGPSTDYQSCQPLDELNGTLKTGAMVGISSGDYCVLHLTLAGLIGFVIGAAVAAIISCIYWRKQQKRRMKQRRHALASQEFNTHCLKPLTPTDMSSSMNEDHHNQLILSRLQQLPDDSINGSLLINNNNNNIMPIPNNNSNTWNNNYSSFPRGFDETNSSSGHNSFRPQPTRSPPLPLSSLGLTSQNHSYFNIPPNN